MMSNCAAAMHRGQRLHGAHARGTHGRETTWQPSPAQHPQDNRSAAHPRASGVQEDVVGNQDTIVGHVEHTPGLISGRAPAPKRAVQLAVVGPAVICGGRWFGPAAVQATGYSLLHLARAG